MIKKNKKRIIFIIISVLLILMGIAILITNKNLKNSNWYLRSWIIELAPYTISLGIMTLGILALKVIKLKELRIALITLWVIINLGIMLAEFIILAWVIKLDVVKEIDGKKYLGVEYYTNRLRKTIIYYEEYNAFAYHKTDEYIEEFYNYNDYEHPEYRHYYKTPRTDSTIYYYDKEGNVTDIKTYDEN